MLAPDDRDLALRMGYSEKTGDLTPSSIQAQLAEAPHDFELRQRIDSGLAASGRFAEVVVIWDKFIAGHPNDPRACYERAGAHCVRWTPRSRTSSTRAISG